MLSSYLQLNWGEILAVPWIWSLLRRHFLILALFAIWRDWEFSNSSSPGSCLFTGTSSQFISVLLNLTTSNKKEPSSTFNTLLKISLARSLSSLGTFSTFHIAAGNNVVKFCHYIRSLSFHFPWYVSHFPETSPEALLKFRFLLCVQVNLACFRIYTSKFFPVFTNWLVRKPLHIFRYLLQYHSTDGTKIYVRYLLLYNTLTQI